MAINRQALQLIRSYSFGTLKCDLYGNGKDMYMTREQIGRALGYSNPQKAIKNIHDRNKERLDSLSVLLKLRATDGKEYETRLYTRKGIYEICRWSNKPKANAFFDWVYDLLEGIQAGRLRVSVEKEYPARQELREATKPAQGSLTDALKEQYPDDEKLHFRIKAHTDLIYSLALGKSAAATRA